jgi:hypothetical protein
MNGPRKGWRKSGLELIALGLAIICLGYMLVRIVSDRPSLSDLTSLEKEITEVQSKSIDLAIETNKFLISVTTLLIGGVAFMVKALGTDHRPGHTLTLILLFALICLTYWFGLKAYGQVTAELSQSAIGLKPDKSYILYYLEMEFRSCLVSAIILGALVVFGYPRNPQASS